MGSLADLLSESTDNLSPLPWRRASAGIVLTIPTYLLAEYYFGELRDVINGANSLGFRAVVTLLAFAWLTPVAHAYHLRWTATNVGALRTRFGVTPSQPVPSEVSIVPGVIGSAAFAMLFFGLPSLLEGRPPTPSVQLTFAIVAGVVFGWVGARLLVALVRDARRLTHLARQIEEVDLLDPDSLAPFTQQGLAGTWLLILMLSLSSHLFIAPGEAAIGSGVMVTIILSAAAVVFTLPMTGVRQLVRQRKVERLAELRAVINPLARSIVQGAEKPLESARLEALLALEQRLMQVREWPVDAASWVRFGLFLLLGLGSWVGAATVEMLMESYL